MRMLCYFIFCIFSFAISFSFAQTDISYGPDVPNPYPQNSNTDGYSVPNYEPQKNQGLDPNSVYIKDENGNLNSANSVGVYDPAKVANCSNSQSGQICFPRGTLDNADADNLNYNDNSQPKKSHTADVQSQCDNDYSSAQTYCTANILSGPQGQQINSQITVLAQNFQAQQNTGNIAEACKSAAQLNSTAGDLNTGIAAFCNNAINNCKSSCPADSLKYTQCDNLALNAKLITLQAAQNAKAFAQSQVCLQQTSGCNGDGATNNPNCPQYCILAGHIHLSQCQVAINNCNNSQYALTNPQICSQIQNANSHTDDLPAQSSNNNLNDPGTHLTNDSNQNFSNTKTQDSKAATDNTAFASGNVSTTAIQATSAQHEDQKQKALSGTINRPALESYDNNSYGNYNPLTGRNMEDSGLPEVNGITDWRQLLPQVKNKVNLGGFANHRQVNSAPEYKIDSDSMREIASSDEDNSQSNIDDDTSPLSKKTRSIGMTTFIFLLGLISLTLGARGF